MGNEPDAEGFTDGPASLAAQCKEDEQEDLYNEPVVEGFTDGFVGGQVCSTATTFCVSAPPTSASSYLNKCNCPPGKPLFAPCVCGFSASKSTPKLFPGAK